MEVQHKRQTRPPKYSAAEHLALLDKIFSKGASVNDFCLEANIAKCTFYEWVKAYPEFAHAYELAVLKAQQWWEQLGLCHINKKEFNTAIWLNIMRRRFGYSDHRRVTIKSIDTVTSAMDKYNLVLKELANGNLTAHELLQLTNVLVNGVKIEENTILKKDVDDIKEQLQLQR